MAVVGGVERGGAGGSRTGGYTTGAGGSGSRGWEMLGCWQGCQPPVLTSGAPVSPPGAPQPHPPPLASATPAAAPARPLPAGCGARGRAAHLHRPPCPPGWRGICTDRAQGHAGGGEEAARKVRPGQPPAPAAGMLQRRHLDSCLLARQGPRIGCPWHAPRMAGSSERPGRVWPVPCMATTKAAQDSTRLCGCWWCAANPKPPAFLASRRRKRKVEGVEVDEAPKTIVATPGAPGGGGGCVCCVHHACVPAQVCHALALCDVGAGYLGFRVGHQATPDCMAAARTALCRRHPASLPALPCPQRSLCCGCGWTLPASCCAIYG